jgi:hypothetical protein
MSELGWAGSAAIAIHFVQVAARGSEEIRASAAPVFEGSDFEEEKSLA